MKVKNGNGCGFILIALTVILISFVTGYSFGSDDRENDLRKEVMAKKEVKDAKEGEDSYRKAYDMQTDIQIERQILISKRITGIVHEIGNIIDSEKEETKKRELEELMIEIANIDNFDQLE